MESIATIASQQLDQNQLAALHKVMLANGDEKNADKILDLYEKMKNDEFTIGFAGHFSAGKSTMINRLLGESILPQSPIPTSANIVKLSSGDGVARIFFHHDSPIEYKEPYDIEMIKEYCKDKDTIKNIELSTSKDIIPPKTSVFDTPGIDAADDADRLITESSLHLVDVLFYVMDYNHVQSEVNLQFLHTLGEKGTPFFVVVNQIDKHDESEIAFATFEASVQQTFQQWDIHPEAIYYTSLINDAAAHNQFGSVKANLFSIMTEQRDKYFSIFRSVKQVAKDHTKFLSNSYDEKIASLSDSGNDLNIEELQLEKENLQQKIATIKGSQQQFEDDFQKALHGTLKSAYLMPYELREKARLFLESQQSDFKVGLFGSKKKTEEEKERRLCHFVQSLREQIDAAIQWKLRDKFANLLKEYDITDRNAVEGIQQISIDYTKEHVLSIVKHGAKVNGEYVLNYTNDVASDIKQQFKRKALGLLDTINQHTAKENKAKIALLQTELNRMEQSLERFGNISLLKNELNDKQQAIEEILRHPQKGESHSLDKLIHSKYEMLEQRNSMEIIQTENEKREEPDQSTYQHNTKQGSVEHVLSSIAQTIETINDLPGFQSIVHDLAAKQDSLKNRTYTIALFGAFSAGKSSFANALIGERALPVSPNPTTAAINRICPASKEHQHGTVIVKMKSAESLFNDLSTILKGFAPTCSNLHDLIQYIQENGIHLNVELPHMYQNYMRAVLTGYQENKAVLGDKVTVTIDEFSRYVSDETLACFVESINLYYDCDITRKGITLVDTPGADSINSRHTNVAFDYIKHADAIIYVTYYNHALSRADKDFLMQLGRVKDTFQLDKMFFVVNAADLAKDESELKLVTDYVEEQLAQLGIRFPKLFPLSSKHALEAKLDGVELNEKMTFFEKEFYQFIQDDLAGITIESAIIDMKRAYQAVNNYMESVNLNEREKVQYRQNLLAKQENCVQLIDKLDSDIYSEQIRQKIEKQLYYVLERFGIRFHDMFKEMFNPTTITESGRKATAQLNRNLENLLDYTGYELVQEMRAVSLRIESFMNGLAIDSYDEMTEKMREVDEKLLLPNISSFELTTPDYKQAFTDIGRQPFQKALALFKGTKTFFEKNEKETMKEEIYKTLVPFAEKYINVNKKIMEDAYLEQWREVVDTIQRQTKTNVDTYIENALSMLTETVDIKLLENKQSVLAAVLASYEVEGDQ